MTRLIFKVGDNCFSANNKALLKEFKRYLHAYGVKSMKEAPQELINASYDLFHIVHTQKRSIYELEARLGIRNEASLKGMLI